MKQHARLIFLALFCLAFLQPVSAQTAQVFTGSGTYTVPVGVTSIIVQAWGGGAGTPAYTAKNPDNGGGGGAFAQSKAIAVTPGQVITVTVGQGGTATSPNGGNSIFGGYITANGAVGQAGGVASTGTYVAYSYAGGSGGNSFYLSGYFQTGAGGGAAAGTNGAGANGGNASISGGGAGGVGAGGGGSGGGFGNGGIAPGGGASAQNAPGAAGQVIVLPQTPSLTFNASGNYVVPAGVGGVTVQLWGGGSGAGSSASINPDNGGGGGAFTQSNQIPVTPGASIAVTVGLGGTPSGVNGGVSSFGTYVAANGATGQAGGTVSSGANVAASYPGGNGGNSYYFFGAFVKGGGGGAGAGTGGPGANGGNASFTAGGLGAVGTSGGGNGGGGGGGGNAPGGGGGAQNSSGGAGQVIVTAACYTLSNISVLGNGKVIANGDTTCIYTDSTNLGQVGGNQAAITRTYVIKNTGTLPLTLKGTTLSGSGASSFITGGISFPVIVAAGASKTFTVIFAPSGAGTPKAKVSVATDNCSTPIYSFDVQGTGANYTNVKFNSSGSFTVPAGITSVVVQAWGGGGSGFSQASDYVSPCYGGGGGAFVQSTPITVTPGTVIPVIVGTGSNPNANYGMTAGGSTSFGSYLTANGGKLDSGGAASTGTYIAASFSGGNGGNYYTVTGGYNFGGGGGAAGTSGPGTNGQNASATANGGGGIGQGGGGNGGNGNGGNGTSPGGGGGGYIGVGAPGRLVVSFICPAQGSIGNAHTATFPSERAGDSISSISNPSAKGVAYTWQQSVNGSTWKPSKTAETSPYYRFDKDSLQAATYYRRHSNACGIYDSTWSNTVKISVGTYENNIRNGQVSGYVYTRNGSSVADGRKVYLKALTPLLGRSAAYLDSTTTQGGQFTIDSVFYGDHTNGDSGTVRFQIYPDTTGGHRYDVDSAVFSLSYANPSKIFPVPSYTQRTPFIDTSVFALTGQALQVCAGCLNSLNIATTITGTVDSVTVTGVGANNAINQQESLTAVTGYQSSQGVYGGYSLNIQLPDSYTVTPQFATHKFVPGSQVVAVSNNVGNINFTDTTTHVISGYFTAGCRDSLGVALLEFDDSLPLGYNGLPRAHQFRKQVTTGAKGYYAIRLPARKYTVHVVSFKVDAADSLAGISAAQVTAFANTLPLAQLYRDITNADTTLNLVYQRAPQVQLSNLTNNGAILQTTCDTRDTIIWPQNITDTLKFATFQGPVAKNCPLDTGKVVVLTNLQLQGNTQAAYDTLAVANNGASLILTSGSPNSLAPFTKTFTYQAIDQYGNYSPTTTLPVVVTGVSTDTTAKTFVTVSPQIPLLVLHDPPGSASFSSWSSNTSIQQSMSFQVKSATAGTVWDEVKIGTEDLVGIGEAVKIAAWASLNDELTVTATNTSTQQFTVSTSNTSTITTGSDAAHVGHDADIFYGAAMNIEYTVGTEVDWNPATCKFTPKPVMVFAPTGINTSYFYTLAEIRDVIIPKLQLGIQTNPDSAAAFQNQISVWQQLLANNAANLRQAPILSNQSFSSGVSYSNSTTLQQTSANTYQFDLDVDNTVAAELGLEAAGSGVKGGVKVKTQLTTSKTISTTQTQQTTIAYTLADNSPGDLISVNIKQDPVYATPMFETVAGETNCPYEPNTVPLDSVTFATSTPVLNNVTGNAAELKFGLGNLSIDPNPRTYTVTVNAATTNGAAVLINGLSPVTPIQFSVKPGGTDSITVAVSRDTISGIYNYDNLIFTVSDACGDFTKSDTVSVNFAAPASGINVATPVNNWLANMASHDTLPVTFNGYNTNALTTVTVQYDSAGNSNWQQLYTYPKSGLGASSTTYNWNIGNLPDGAYNLRLAVEDDLAGGSKAIVYSPVVNGLIDRTPPALYGTPQPANGLYTAGTQVSFSYTENINNAALKPTGVRMKDITNNTTIPVQFNAFGNTVVVVPGINLLQYNGHNVMVVADSVCDLYGNIKTTPDTAYFTIGTASFSTGTSALNVTINKTSVYEDAKDSMAVRFNRNSRTTAATVIYYNLAGNAVYGKDYTVTYNLAQTFATGINGAQGTIVLPADSATVTMYIHPVRDTLLEANKTTTITLAPGGGYTIGSNYSVTDTILNHSIAPPVITASKATTLCAGDSVTLSTKDSIGGVPVTLLWNTGATTASIKVKTSGTYTVKATNKQGFTSYSAPTVVTFTCGNPASLAVKIVNKDTMVLSWAQQGCAAKYLVQFRPVGTTAWTTDTVATSLDSIKNRLKFNTAYQWQVASLCGKAPYAVSGYTAGTNFTTPLSTAAGIVPDNPSGKIVVEQGMLARVYPNPATPSATLEVKGASGPYSIMLVNMQGAVLWQAQKLTDTNVKLPLERFASGIYLVVVMDKEHTARLKVVKQ